MKNFYVAVDLISMLNFQKLWSMYSLAGSSTPKGKSRLSEDGTFIIITYSNVLYTMMLTHTEVLQVPSNQ